MSLFSLHGRKKNVIVLGANGMLGHDVVELLMDEQKKAQSCIGIVTALTHYDINIELPFSLSEIVSRDQLNLLIKYDYVLKLAITKDDCLFLAWGVMNRDWENELIKNELIRRSNKKNEDRINITSRVRS